MKIKKITAREILDSRGNPTVSCSLFLDNGQCVEASVPSGASVGAREAVELRDGDKSRYSGMGVLCAIKNIEKVIAPALVGKNVDLLTLDKTISELDGTENKSVLGANAMLAVSIAVIRAQALINNRSLYQEIALLTKNSPKIPKVMYNVLNGGAHADNGLRFQEFMIMPVQETFAKSLEAAVLIYRNLKSLLREKGLSTGVGDEGGFAPKIDERTALDYLMMASERSKFKPGSDVFFCLDVAASQFVDDKQSYNNLISLYKTLIKDYPIYSIEDGLAEDDWSGWALMTKELKIMLVGDDLFVSNKHWIEKGVKENVANAVLIKPNQIGLVSESLESIAVAKKYKYKTVASHRSGETNDSFLADLAVGAATDFCKSGAPVRGERVAKYNRFLEIEQS